MSIELLFRLLGMLLFAFLGIRFGISLATIAESSTELWGFVLGLVGLLFGFVLTPHLTVFPVRKIRENLKELSNSQIVSGTIGLVVGLVLAALMTVPLSLLGSPTGAIVSIILAFFLAYLGMATFSSRHREIFDLFARRTSISRWLMNDSGDALTAAGLKVLLDTSVIIDGRIADICKTGFIMGPIIVPRFVLNELHHVADSTDPLRRSRGRRGIEILNEMQKDSLVPVSIVDLDTDESELVDEKLIILARQLDAAIVTNDYNLNRIADLQGVTVLNINDLANAVKAIFLPGENLTIEVIQEGREIGQGVGYLEDGTMVVVESGRRFVDSVIEVVVTKVLQTSAGRMIFARPADE